MLIDRIFATTVVNDSLSQHPFRYNAIHATNWIICIVILMRHLSFYSYSFVKVNNVVDRSIDLKLIL